MTYWYKDCVKPCGTSAAWWRHKRHGEPPCEPCRAAENQRRRKYRRYDRYDLTPITPRRAARNREILIRELNAYQQAHGPS